MRTAELVSLTRDEQRALNQINAHEYLRLFVLAEEFIIPALLDHSRSIVHGNPARLRAILISRERKPSISISSNASSKRSSASSRSSAK